MSRVPQAIRVTQWLIIFAYILFVTFSPVGTVVALSSNSGDCKDVSVVFLRGSGQNKEHLYLDNLLDDRTFGQAEKESYTFFKNHANHFNNDYPNITYKAVSIHDFPGKYDPVGYQAVGVGLSEVANTANADVSWIPGDYQASVQHGVAETVGYLKDQIASCPNQYFIVGGYSQGAQVMGESLFQLKNEERSKILGVGLFGDPKYIGSTAGLHVMPTISFPWRRGEATNKDTGMLEPRFPYVPEGMENRTLSWCNRYDIVCGGWSALRKNSTHSAYSENSIGYAVNELVSIAAPQLLALDKNPDGTPVPPVQLSQADKNRERDVMFVMNDNSNSDVLNTFRYYLDPTMTQFVGNFTGTRFAAKSFGEHDYGFSAPRVDNVQSFLPYTGFNPSNPVFTASNLTRAFADKYPFGQPIVGGGDIPDPHELAIERAVVSTGWRDDPNVERNIVLITDRPPKDPYEYNICNSTIRQWMHYPDIDGYKNCYTNYNREVWQKVLVPETCETILKVITEDTCTNPLMSPNYVQTNKRTLEDEIKLAQAYHTKISVVIPRKFDPAAFTGNRLDDPKVRDKLRHLAEATGGTFIYYDTKTQYNSTSLYDTLWRVFTKKPGSMDIVADGEKAPKILGFQTNAPAILDVSRSGIVAASYKWDFDDNGTWDETSQGPVIEHQFVTVGQGLFRTQAVGSDGTILGETRQIYTVSPSETPVIEKPSLPTGINAAQQADGTVLVTWAPENAHQLVVFDPETSLPIAAAPMANGSLTIPTFYENLVIRVISDTAASDPLTIPVEVYVAPPPPVIDPPVIVGEPCCELQESAPEPPAPPILQGPDETPQTAVINPPQTDPEPEIVVDQNPDPSSEQIPVSSPEITTPDTTSNPTVTDMVVVSQVVSSAVQTTTQTTQLPISDILENNFPKVAGISINKLPTAEIKTPDIAPRTSKTRSINWFLLLLLVLIAAAFFGLKHLKRKQK